MLDHVERALIPISFAVLFFVLPHEPEGDDFTRFDGVLRLINGHVTADKHSLLMPLASVPLFELGHVVESNGWWAMRFNVVVVALGAAAAWRLLRNRVDPALFRRTLLVLLGASLLTNRLRSYDPAVLAGTLIALGVVCVAYRRRAALGWAAAGVGAAMTPVVFLALVPLAVYDVVRSRTIRAVAFAAIGLVLVLGEDWIRRGSPFDTGYERDRGFATSMPYSGHSGFSYPFLLGVAAIVFSFGRGLVFFTPGLAFAFDPRVRERLRPLFAPLLLLTVALVLVYAKWWAWYGGISWGPRFFVFAALPASLLLAARLPVRPLAATVVLALSAWVGFTGATSDYSQLRVCEAHRYANEGQCLFEPAHSSLWWWAAHPPGFTAQRIVLAAWCAAVFATLALPPLAASLARRR